MIEKKAFMVLTVLRCCPLACVYAMVVGLRGESPLQVPEKPSVFHPYAQRNAFHRRDARPQAKIFRPLESIAET